MAKSSAKKAAEEPAPEPASESASESASEPAAPTASPIKGMIANIATGVFGGWKDRLVKGVARPLAGGFIAGVGLAIAFGMAIYATFDGIARMIVSPYSDTIRPFAEGLVTLLLIGALAFIGIRIATRGRGREAVKFCKACFEAVPAEATKCRACGTDL